MSYTIHFLYHSGFIFENSTHIFVFDYFQDPEHTLEKVLENKGKRKVYFFVSHVHGDHFNPSIARYEEEAAGYYFHADCRLPLNDAAKGHPMEVGDTLAADGFSVHMYGSTDVGGSFMISFDDGFTLFHAGDLNWWHWVGEPDADNRGARDWFFRELSEIKETHVDLAFLPVDARQQAAREWGVKQYLSHFQVDLLVPMHAFGPAWIPSYEFRWLYPEQCIWIPHESGDSFRKQF